MINAILNGIFSLVINLSKFLLIPIDALISEFFPEFDPMISAIGQMFNVVLTYSQYLLRTFGISDYALALLLSYYIFKLTVPIGISVVKGAIKWYKVLKP